MGPEGVRKWKAAVHRTLGWERCMRARVMPDGDSILVADTALVLCETANGDIALMMPRTGFAIMVVHDGAYVDVTCLRRAFSPATLAKAIPTHMVPPRDWDSKPVLANLEEIV